MKRLVLVRHAKAVPYGYDDDFDRELQERGINDAGRIGQRLKEMGIVPDLIISSPAKRAITTARIIAEKTGFPYKTIREDEEIYNQFTSGQFLDYIRELPDDADTVFMFGHNPGFYHYAVNLLTHFYEEFPTCATIGIDFPVDSWQKTGARSGEKAFFLIPKAVI